MSSMFIGKFSSVDLADVIFIEARGTNNVYGITKATTWNTELHDYNNAVVFSGDEVEVFKQAWTAFKESQPTNEQTCKRLELAKAAMQGDWAAQNPETGIYNNKFSDADFLALARLYFRMADAMLEVDAEA